LEKGLEKVKLEEVSKPGRKPIPMKMVFKIKDEQDGSQRFKIRIVTKGFLAILGVDFT
jgi:hypothetical protein